MLFQNDFPNSILEKAFWGQNVLPKCYLPNITISICLGKHVRFHQNAKCSLPSKANVYLIITSVVRNCLSDSIWKKCYFPLHIDEFFPR